MTDMLTKVKFAKDASDEFRQSVEWYESRVHGLGLKFTDEIDRVRLNPDSYQSVIGNTRKIQVNKFPYSVFYTIDEDTLVILRIFFTKRENPLTW